MRAARALDSLIHGPLLCICGTRARQRVPPKRILCFHWAAQVNFQRISKPDSDRVFFRNFIVMNLGGRGGEIQFKSQPFVLAGGPQEEISARAFLGGFDHEGSSGPPTLLTQRALPRTPLDKQRSLERR